jgi:phosphoglycolate phosphatase-like HAD superfamily hydrolase
MIQLNFKIKYHMPKYLFLAIVIAVFFSCKQAEKRNVVETDVPASEAATILPSWNEGETRKSIIDFVALTTVKDSPGYIPEEDRIACFDNDGTLWSEQPLYFQLLFAIDQIKATAPKHPEWTKKEPFSSLLKGDMKSFMASGEKGIAAVMMASHADMSTEDFDKAVKAWISTAKHPVTGKPYDQMTYQPMVELLQYLRANGFKTFIVSGGGIDFMRAWAEKVYGIPSYQIIGSSIKAKYETQNGKPVLIKKAELNFVDDKEGKPVGIHQHIGKRPVFSAGNSDGDYAMLEWTTTAPGYPRFGMMVHHTDSTREFAYDRKSHIGQLNKGLDSAATFKWTIVDMKKDWKKVFSFE